MVWRKGRREREDGVSATTTPPRAADLLFQSPAPGGGPAVAETATDPKAPIREPVFARRHIEALVTTVYQILLRRDPDPKGLYDHSDRLHDDATLAGVAMLLRHVASSTEYQDRATPEACDLVLKRDVIPVFGPVHHLIGLGAHAAWLAQSCDLRRWVGPFDGILATPDMVVRCLEDDFAAFLDPGLLAAVQPGYTGTHRLFQDQALLSAQSAEPLLDRDPTLPEHRAHYERCVARFRRLLRSPDAKCFVMLPTWPADRSDAELEAAFERLHTALSARTTGFRLLLVGIDTTTPGPSHALQELASHPGSLFRFRASSLRHPRAGFAQAWDDGALKRLLWRSAYDLHPEP